MEIIIEIILVLVVLELFEIYVQKADTLEELIDKLHEYYRQSIFLFFLIHPSFYYVLGVLFYFDAFNFYGMIILIFKTFDIFFKIELIQQFYYKNNMDSELEKMLTLKLTPLMKFLALLVHVPLLFMAILPIFY